MWKYDVEAQLYVKRVEGDDWEFVEVKSYEATDLDLKEIEGEVIVEFSKRYGLESLPHGDFDAGYPFSDFDRGFYRTYYYEMPEELAEETGIEEWKVEFIYEKRRWIEEEE